MAKAQKKAKRSSSKKPSKQIRKTPKPAKFTKHIDLFRNQIDYFTLDNKYGKCGLATRAIHSGNHPDPLHGGVVPSIDLSTTYAQPSPGQPSSCFDYTRCGNPTVLAL